MKMKLPRTIATTTPISTILLCGGLGGGNVEDGFRAGPVGRDVCVLVRLPVMVTNEADDDEGADALGAGGGGAIGTWVVELLLVSVELEVPVVA